MNKYARAMVRFRAKYVKVETGCWLWTASKIHGGYGQFRGLHSQMIGAHRFAYMAHRGSIPKGLQLDHLCRVTGCVNPDHLEPVTCGENIRRGETGANNRNKTHCLRGHPLSGENLYVYASSGKRECRLCRRVRYRSQREDLISI